MEVDCVWSACSRFKDMVVRYWQSATTPKASPWVVLYQQYYAWTYTMDQCFSLNQHTILVVLSCKHCWYNPALNVSWPIILATWQGKCLCGPSAVWRCWYNPALNVALTHCMGYLTGKVFMWAYRSVNMLIQSCPECCIGPLYGPTTVWNMLQM